MSQDTARALLDALPMAGLLIGPDGRIAALNDQAETLLGQGLAGQSYLGVLRQPASLAAIDAALREGRRAEGRFAGPNDSHFILSCAPVAAPPLRGLLVCLTDVTRLEVADAQRRDFVANVSHELRTPLTALAGFIDTLKGPAREDRAARDRFLGLMAQEAERMRRLVGDLLALSTVERDARTLPRERVDLRACCERALALIAPQAEAAEVRLMEELPQSPLEVTGDGDQLVQLLTNLLENAVVYGGAGNRVTLRLAEAGMNSRLRGRAARIDVSDTGPGIPAHHLPRLTERFYRVDSHRSRRDGGTGLGLAIVKHVALRHRGYLSIDSTPGQGSRFSVFLPLAPGPAGEGRNLS